MEKITTMWHKATESPGKRPIYLLCKHGKHKHLVAHHIQFYNSGIIPAECDLGLDAKGNQQLPVAWAFAEEITKKIPQQFITDAENAAWAWYGKTDNKENENIQ